jgi:hypothetical protein
MEVFLSFDHMSAMNAMRSMGRKDSSVTARKLPTGIWRRVYGFART